VKGKNERVTANPGSSKNTGQYNGGGLNKFKTMVGDVVLILSHN